MGKSTWSQEDIEFLKNNYPHKGKSYCATALKRKESAVRYIASVLGIRKDWSSDFHKMASKRGGEKLIGRRRPDHSNFMKEKAIRGELWQQKNPNIKHGLSGTKVYSVWRGMMDRCYKKTDKGYHLYGGRGISVCDEWKDLFVFKEWFDKNKKEGMSIDRIDNNGSYSPQNCRFASSATQNQNRRSNTINMNIAREMRRMYKNQISQREIGRRLGISYKTVNEVVLNKTWVERLHSFRGFLGNWI